MKMIPLNAHRRPKSGTGPSRRDRRAGQVPAVLYGPGAEPVHVTMNERDFLAAIHGAQGEHAIVDLTVVDQPDLGGPTMLKEVQKHPVRGHIVHADLMRIDLSRKITTLVPTKLEGRAAGIVEGGIVEHSAREVEVSCLPTAIPDFLSVDITELHIGHSLPISALVVPEGVEVLTNPERVLVTILVPRVAVVETPAAAAAGAEGAAAPAEGAAAGAEGAAPAAKGAAPAAKGAAPAGKPGGDKK